MEGSRATWLQHYIMLPLIVDGREQSNLTLTLYTATIEGREQSDLTSILYTATTNTVSHYHRKLMEGSRATWLQHCLLLPQKVDRREQSDLTSTLYTATTEGREQSNLTSILYTTTTNTVPHYHRKLMEGSKATWLQHCNILLWIVDGREQSDLTEIPSVSWTTYSINSVGNFSIFLTWTSHSTTELVEG